MKRSRGNLGGGEVWDVVLFIFGPCYFERRAFGPEAGPEVY